MRNNRFLMKACGAFCSSIGIILLIGFTSDYQSEVSFKANAISATGTIVSTKEEKHNTGTDSGGYAPYPRGNWYQPVTGTTSYISTVEFQTQRSESIEFTTIDACFSQQQCKNKTVLVEYIPSTPKQARIHFDNSDTALNVRFGVRILFSLFCISIGFWLLSSKSRKHKGTNN
jgi:hypothetical protein